MQVVPNDSSPPLRFGHSRCCQLCGCWSKKSCICSGLLENFLKQPEKKFIAECHFCSEHCPQESCSGTWGEHCSLCSCRGNSINQFSKDIILSNSHSYNACNNAIESAIKRCNADTLSLDLRYWYIFDATHMILMLLLTAFTPGSLSAARRRSWTRWWRSARGTPGSGLPWLITSPPPPPLSSQLQPSPHSFTSSGCSCLWMGLMHQARLKFEVHIVIDI